jgi:hypothetical protein
LRNLLALGTRRLGRFTTRGQDHGLLNRLERLSHRSLKKRPMYNAAAFMFPFESVLF